MLTSFSGFENGLIRFNGFGQNEIDKNAMRGINLIQGQKNTGMDGYNMKAGYYINRHSREYKSECDKSFSKSI